MSTLHLPNLTNAPPSGGWRYVVPETGQRFVGSSLSELMHNLAAHYKAAGYPQPPNLMRLVEDFICAEVPEACGEQPRPDSAEDAVKQGWVAGLKHTFTNIVTGTQTLAAWIAGGRHYVDSGQANARAAVCTSGFNGQPCPENVEPQGCNGCNLNTLKEVVRSVVGSRTTTSDSRLLACRVCGCDLKAKVHLPHAVLWQHMPDAQKQQLPEWCWLVRENAAAPSPTSATTTSLMGGITTINAPPLT